MNKLPLLLLFLFGVATAQTTMAEYKYLTVGYEQDLASGHDLKDGYDLVNLGGYNLSLNNGKDGIERSCRMYGFKKKENQKMVALLLVVMRKDTGIKYYICLPSNDSSDEIRSLAVTDFFKRFNARDEETIVALHYYWLSIMNMGNYILFKENGITD